MKTFNIDLGGYKIIQLSNQSHTQTMSYIITTPNKHVLLIDGGMMADADYLRSMLKSLGSKIDMLFITHCHADHFGAPMELIKNPDGIEIAAICYNFPPSDWIYSVEPGTKEPDIFYKDIPKYTGLTLTPIKGNTYIIDGLKLDILKDCSDYEKYGPEDPVNSSNDSSIVFRITFPNGKTALFLGDLGLNAGETLADMYGSKLKSDIVQMAHHGQEGVGKRVYELIKPQVCLWSTPYWLWVNDNGNGPGTGPFLTLEVRAWIDEIGVPMNGREFDGDVYVI